MTRTAAWLIALFAAMASSAPALAQQAKPGAEPQFKADMTLARAGEKVFTAKVCVSCHTIGKGRLVGPDLNGVFERRSADWLRRWLRDPTAMLANDDTAKALLREYNGVSMPNLKLSDAEIDALLHYIASEQNRK